MSKKIIYEIKNLGRSEWCGEVTARSAHPEHVEAALVGIARKHLMSRNIDFNGDTECGNFTAGFRVVGEYKRKGA